jgi:hypothetical protein
MADRGDQKRGPKDDRTRGEAEERIRGVAKDEDEDFDVLESVEDEEERDEDSY